MNRARLVELIGEIPGVSRVLRWMANRYEEGSVVSIQYGYVAGLLWRRHHRYVNGYWIGQFEHDVQEALARELSPGDTFYDVGANAGFFTLVAARRVGAGGRCVSFDPDPENVASIREQVEVNRFAHCCVVPHAVADREGTVRFSLPYPGSLNGHLGEPGESERATEVTAISLDLAIERYGRPSVIKVDVEGAESLVLRGAGRVIRDVRPKWLIELHNADCEREVRATLGGAGYSFHHIDASPVSAGAVLPHHVFAFPGRSGGGS